MRRIILMLFLVMASFALYGQKPFTKEVLDSLLTCEGVSVNKECVRYSGSTFTEIYNVVTDSVVYRYGLKFRSSDSTFIKKLVFDRMPRSYYDEMQRATAFALEHMEEMEKQTVELLDRYYSTRDVWIHFMLLSTLGVTGNVSKDK